MKRNNYINLKALIEEIDGNIVLANLNKFLLPSTQNEEKVLTPIVIKGLNDIPIIVRIIKNKETNNSTLYQITYQTFPHNDPILTTYLDGYLFSVDEENNEYDVKHIFIPNYKFEEHQYDAPIVYNNEEIQTLYNLKSNPNTYRYINKNKHRLFTLNGLIDTNLKQDNKVNQKIKTD